VSSSNNNSCRFGCCEYGEREGVRAKNKFIILNLLHVFVPVDVGLVLVLSLGSSDDDEDEDE